MIEYENPSFKASKYAPNPLEFTYWIDLSTDTSGNVIRTYDSTENRWVPLNRDYNKDQWLHISELVNVLGFEWDKIDDDQIELPDLTSNNYFSGGSNLVESLSNGDKRIKAAITEETNRAKAAENQLQVTMSSLQSSYTNLVTTVASLQTSVQNLMAALQLSGNDMAQVAADTVSMEDDLGLG